MRSCDKFKKLDHDHDIPYLAGYSKDGKTIYIDRHMPRTMKLRGREIDSDRFLILHEEVEKTLIDQLGLHYLHAHQIATRAEEAAVPETCARVCTSREIPCDGRSSGKPSPCRASRHRLKQKAPAIARGQVGDI